MYILGDWGTSRLRVYLHDNQQVIDRKTGPGIGGLAGRIPDVLINTISSWKDSYGLVPIYLTGMVGSTIGWVETPYAECPVTAAELAERMINLSYEGHQISIAAGVSCINPTGAVDVMRGEETQIVGALSLDPALAKGTHLLCLPGTHTKWALVRDGAIVNFLTALTGELFALLREHSVLVQSSIVADVSTGGAFEEGVARAGDLVEASLLHSLFEVRSRQVKNLLPEAVASQYLSGLIIGSDICGAMKLLGGENYTPPLTIIGAPELTCLYREACRTMDLLCEERDGGTTSIRGLTALTQLRKESHNDD